MDIKEGIKGLVQNASRLLNVYQMFGYCEKHQQPWDIRCLNGEWVCECPKCRIEGLLDMSYDNKTTMKIQQEWTVSDHALEN